MPFSHNTQSESPGLGSALSLHSKGSIIKRHDLLLLPSWYPEFRVSFTCPESLQVNTGTSTRNQHQNDSENVVWDFLHISCLEGSNTPVWKRGKKPHTNLQLL